MSNPTTTKPREFFIALDEDSCGGGQMAETYRLRKDDIHAVELTPSVKLALENYKPMSELILLMKDAMEKLLNNWPSKRDGMDWSEPIPVGVKSCRYVLENNKEFLELLTSGGAHE
jgi:hypothetical protein